MITNNSSFENYPIEFKEINPEDFTLTSNLDGTASERDAFTIENNGAKILISPDEEGYINDEIQKNINLDSKNTVVINAGVGQGKSYAIIQTIKRYYKSEQDYIIMVASPYVSLVKQYVKDINEVGIPIEHIYNYENIGVNPSETYHDKKVHVITVNTLLGNPGGDEVKNSDAKRSYLNTLSNYCENTGTKVIFIYDEIHASYVNFKEEYIFNLWKWRNVIHKNFVISATHNEASKIIIEYLAELTDRKIKIIESKRLRIRDKQSSLFLHFSPAISFKADNNELVKLINTKLDENKNIDILCFSKKLCKDIVKSETGTKLKNKFGQVKLCVSELVNQERPTQELPKNQFDNSKCNIGTNFSTGVSIKKENHAFIIILPSKNTRGNFKNNYGIFTNGVNSIIQALARQRVKGEIHLLMYKPDKFDFNSLNDSSMDKSQKEEFISRYSSIQNYRNINEEVEYYSINFQKTLLRRFYAMMRGDLTNEIDYLNNQERINLSPLTYPSFSKFLLEKSENYLASKFKIFGKDISACTTYLALTNQFLNCKLVSVFSEVKLHFKENEIQKTLFYYYKKYLNPSQDVLFFESRLYGNFHMFYRDIRTDLFNDFDLVINSEQIKPYKHKDFEIELLKFCYNIYYERKYFENTIYSRSEYFHDCIKAANTSEEQNDKIKFYKLIDYFRKQIINNLESLNVRNSEIHFLPNNPIPDFFSDENKNKFDELIGLVPTDEFLANDIFSFRRNLLGSKPIEDKLTSLYKMILEDFFVSETYKHPVISIYGKKIISIKQFSNEASIDIVSEPNLTTPHTEKDIIYHFESMENYLKEKEKIEELLSKLI